MIPVIAPKPSAVFDSQASPIVAGASSRLNVGRDLERAIWNDGVLTFLSTNPCDGRHGPIPQLRRHFDCQHGSEGV
jgi:hypothetical protein